jgi:predicted ribonuclease YlaK/intein/homing endonuclease
VTRKKTYILDTSVYLTDFNAIYAFKNNDIVIPMKVLEEIDGHKKRQDSVGLNARMIIKIFDDLRSVGSLQKGVKIKKGLGTIMVKGFDPEVLPNELSVSDSDNQIIATALTELKLDSSKKVAVVSRDINMRVKCDALGIPAEDYFSGKIINNAHEIYTGYKEILVDDADIDRFYDGEPIRIDDEKHNVEPNQFLMLISNTNNKKTALARYMGKLAPLKKVVSDYPSSIWGLTPRNKEQCFAMDLLLDKSIPIVSLIGKAGSGKTLCALAAGLHQVLDPKSDAFFPVSTKKSKYSSSSEKKGKDEQTYKRLIVSRPVQPLGKDIGFLPGPQPLDAKIATPQGWTTMGELKVDDLVMSGNGNPSKVLKIFPKGLKEVYKITTSDGSSTEACLDHLWMTQTFEERKRKKEATIKTTKEIIDTLKTHKGKNNHFLPRNKPLEYLVNELPIPPYTLGAILGDGCIKDSVCIANTDIELVNRVNSELSELGCRLTNDGKTIIYNIVADLYNNKPARQVKIVNTITDEINIYPSIGKALEVIDINRSTLQSRCQNNLEIDGLKYEFIECKNRWQNPVKNSLESLGLSNKKAWDKFIPDIYRYSSVQDRISILQGLMDTDGTIKKNGESSYTTTSLQLAKDVQEIVRSLGGRALIRERNRINKKTTINEREVKTIRISYEFNISLPNDINPFFISRKANRYQSKYMHSVAIEKIELIGEKETQCILIDDPEHLYVTDEFIVTHNSLEEKMAPWLKPVQDNLQFLLGDDKTTLEMYMETGVIEIEALTYIRGRSISNAYIIIDESQNLTKHELKTIITRVGEGTKIVLTGDIEQIDNIYLDETTNGLTYAVEKFKPFNITGHITLMKGERSEVATLAAKIL